MTLVTIDKQMSKAKYLAYDFETGGLSSEKHPPLQLAMLVVDENYVELDAQCVRLKPIPGYTIEPVAAQINGYNEKDWESAWNVVDAELYFAKFIHQWFSDTLAVGVGHNIRRFDVLFMQKFFPVCARMLSPDMVDTMVEFKAWRAQRNMLKVRHPQTGALVNGKNNLATLAKYAGHEMVKAHDARWDCRASIAGLKWIKTNGVIQKTAEAEFDE